MLNETTLTKEIRKWSKEVLEPPSSKHQDLPACPYAKNSWDKDKVKCILGEGGLWKDLIPYIENFDDTFDVVIYCATDYDDITADEVNERINIINEYAVEKNIWVMGAHPDTNIAHAVVQDNFTPITDEDYYQVFVQRLDILVRASDNIKAKGYYQNYLNNDFNNLVKGRKKKWLEQIKQK
tara:strand:+ start:225 stop:767 length:543 start_codon:yes stop_codon:yes gene_type:complete